MNHTLTNAKRNNLSVGYEDNLISNIENHLLTAEKKTSRMMRSL